jgi:O-6-methylguanine DNA methyltransferase
MVEVLASTPPQTARANPRSRARETLFCSLADSPFGPLTLAVSEQGVVSVHFGRARLTHANLVESAERTAACRKELAEYFAGERTRFTVPLDLRGTSFQQQCWQALLKIPYGDTRSYADIARAIGRPQAFRAVGMANHDNPVAIIVPCHRVVGSNGNLTGYGGGLDVKRQLLELERRHRIIG